MPMSFDSESRDRPSTPGPTYILYRSSHEAMATTFEVAAYGANRDYLAAVVNEVFEEIDRLEAQLSNYRPDSEVSYINRAAAHHPVVVEPGLFGLIRDAIRYSSETAGAFDITIGPLLKAWGFVQKKGRVPEAAEIAQMLKTVGYAHVKLNAAARTLWFDELGVQLDLGGIGKGFAVDRTVEILRSSGVTRALVSSGTSSIFALGAPPDARTWDITLRDPFDAQKAADVIHLKNCSLSTSGNYENFFEENGKIYSHILDPVTGRPVEGMLSAAVLALSATESEALSTAFFVMGPEHAGHYVAAHPNLSLACYQATETPGQFRRVVGRSVFNDLPPEVVAEISSPLPSHEEVRDAITGLEPAGGGK